MARAFDFNTATRSKARLRQDSSCAFCGENLDDMEEHAHHVIPNQSGDPGNAAHRTWAATLSGRAKGIW